MHVRDIFKAFVQTFKKLNFAFVNSTENSDLIKVNYLVNKI